MIYISSVFTYNPKNQAPLTMPRVNHRDITKIYITATLAKILTTYLSGNHLIFG